MGVTKCIMMAIIIAATYRELFGFKYFYFAFTHPVVFIVPPPPPLNPLNSIKTPLKFFKSLPSPPQLVKLESTGNETELLTERLKQTERELTNIKKEASNYQNMLQQSQTQYMTLDKKYNKAKRIVRDFQQREIDMVHREEFYQQLLQEKDTEYNALVKNLKDRVIHLEQELEDTQRKAGMPVLLPYDSASLKVSLF